MVRPDGDLPQNVPSSTSTFMEASSRPLKTIKTSCSDRMGNQGRGGIFVSFVFFVIFA
jgi:hypothetical protein